jgi:perosamine synthetase
MNLFQSLTSLINVLRGKHHQYKKVDEFTSALSELLGHKYITSMPHARIALYYSLRCYNFSKGDEVLMTAINLPDMVNVIRSLGLKEIFVDIDFYNYSLDLEDVEKKMTKDSKFLFVTHLNGIVPEMEKITSFAKDHNLILIQDCTQNVGAEYAGKKIEEFSELSIISLCDLKVIHTHMGGIVVSQSRSMIDEITNMAKRELRPLKTNYIFKFIIEDLIASFLLNRIFFTCFAHPVLSLFKKIIGDQAIQDLTRGGGLKLGRVIIFKGLFGGGSNIIYNKIPDNLLYKYSDLQASIGLTRISGFTSIEEKRITNAIYFNSLICNIPERNKASFNKESKHVFWKFPIKIMEREDEFVRMMYSKGIDVAKSNLPCLSSMEGFDDSSTPHAEELIKSTFYIPLHYYLDKDEIFLIAKNLCLYFGVKINDQLL